MAWRARVGAIVVAVAATVGSLLVTSPSARAADCADVLVLGARGSSQPQGGDATDGGTGLGAQVRAADDALRLALPGVNVQTEAIAYPALSVAVAAISPSRFVAGLEQGVAWTKARLAQSAAQCPQQRVVLMGYSQGAMVMHRVLADLVTAHDSATLGRIDGSLLLADGDRFDGDGARRWGTARRGAGIAQASPASFGVRQVVLPRAVGQRTHSVCDRGDIVCDPSGASGEQTGAEDVHLTHYRASLPVRRAVAVIARDVRASL